MKNHRNIQTRRSKQIDFFTHQTSKTTKATMKHPIILRALLAGFIGGMGIFSSHAQFTFDSGSNGSYGPMNITSNTTLAMPADGIFHCTTINVADGATLKFTPNAMNTPVYLLATGNVTIAGTIDVSGARGTAFFGGAGGPGGFSGGAPASAGVLAGDGHGPGAGRAGGTYGGPAAYSTVGSSYGNSSTNKGAVYGSPILVPLVGGSGGSGYGSYGGWGGGGAILIASNSRIEISGSVRASGPVTWEIGWFDGVGSGGAVRLICPVVSGNGTLDVTGSQNLNWSARGGAGRIRIDCIDRRSLALTSSPSSANSIGANMMTFPANSPRLDITQAAGNTIAVGTNSPVFFMLPQGSSANQTVTVQASNFGAVVPIRIALTPDNGSSSTYDAQIDNSGASPASVTVPVVVPVNVQVHVEAWTR